MVDHHAGLCARRFFDLPHGRIIHRHARGMPRLGMVRRNHCRFGHRLVGRLAAVRHEDDVRAVDLLRVEPDVALKCRLKRQQVVLQVVFARKHVKTVARAVVERLCLHGLGTQLFVARLLVRQHARLRQLLAQLSEVSLALRFAKAHQHALQIVQFRAPLLDLLRQHLFRSLGLVVLLEVPLGILLRRQAHVQRDLDLRAVLCVIIYDLGLVHALFQLVQVGGDQVAHALVLLAVLGRVQLLLLGGKLARQPVARIDHSLVQIGRAARHALRLSFFFKERRKQRGKAAHRRHVHHTFVLRHRQKGEVKHRAVLRAREQERFAALFAHKVHQVVEHLAELLPLLRRHLSDRLGSIPCRAVGQLAAQQR